MSEIPKTTGRGSGPELYEIRLRGIIDERWSEDLGGLVVVPGTNDESSLIGEVKDQAMLHGIIRRIRDAGMTLIALNQVNQEYMDRVGNRKPVSGFGGGDVDKRQSVLRWGGICGLVGVAFLVLAVPAALFGVGDDPAELQAWVTRFPRIKSVRVLENGLYLVGLVLQVPLFLAVHHALREKSPAAGLFGPALAIVGLVIMATVAAPHGSHAPLSALAQDPTMTSADQQTIALMWQALWGVFHGVLNVGFVVVPLGLVIVGIAARVSGDIGKTAGYTILGLGAVALVSGFAQFADPPSDAGFVTYLACLVSYGLLSSKAIRLGRVR